MSKNSKHQSGTVAWSRLALCMLIAGGAVFLLYGNRADFGVILPYLFLLACPLIHLLGHSGHGSHGPHQGDR